MTQDQTIEQEIQAKGLTAALRRTLPASITSLLKTELWDERRLKAVRVLFTKPVCVF